MNFSYLNPFSSNFIKWEPERSAQRELEASRNSYSTDEDTVNWRTALHGWGSSVRANDDPYDNNGILFEMVFATKRQKINWYRSMEKYPLVRKGLTIMTDESVGEKINGEFAEFDVVEAQKKKIKKSEYKQLKEEFDYIMNQVFGSENLWSYYYKWLMDGELFLEICLNDEGDKVVGLKVLPPYCTMAIYNDGIIDGYIEDTTLLYDGDMGNGQGEKKPFTKDQIAYINYGYWGSNRNDIRGHLEWAIRPLNQLRAIEDSLVVYRITRAPEKRIWNIYTGKMPPSQVPGYLQQIRTNYRKNLTLDPVSGATNSGMNVQAMTEDYWFSKDSEGQGTTVENFKGSTEFNGQLDDLNMFRGQVMDALQIPFSRWKTEESGGSPYAQGVDAVNMDELSFQKLNKKLRRRFVKLIYQVFLVHLRARGYKSKFLDQSIYKIDLVPSTDFEKMKNLALAEKRGGVLGAFSTFLPSGGNVKPDSEDPPPLFSTQFFMEDIMGFTTEQLLKNEDMLRREKEALLKQAEEAKKEGGEEDEDGGGDDLGF